jgi:predicted PurR-regulated permease PerM
MADSSARIWHRPWFGVALAMLVVLLVAMFLGPPLLALLYAVRSVLVPVVLGLALAYIVNPLVTMLERRARLPRPISAIGLIMAVGMLALTIIVYLVPKLYEQSENLIKKMPSYIEHLADRMGLDIAAMSQQARDWILSMQNPDGADTAAGSLAGADLMTILKSLLNVMDIGARAVTSTFGLASYLVLAAVIMLFCFFFFVWKFQAVVQWFAPFVPHARRVRTLEIIAMMDKSVAAFIRGRLIQATAVAVVLSVGWKITGVPYWLLLSLAGGMLNLIPYAAVVAWPIAILLTYVDSLSGGQASDIVAQVPVVDIATVVEAFDYMGILVWPSLVYFAAQLLDGWVVEPLVQGKATDLDPLTVLLVVLIGGSLLGLLGLLIAIPAAACIKILAREIILPRLRELAARQPAT